MKRTARIDIKRLALIALLALNACHGTVKDLRSRLGGSGGASGEGLGLYYDPAWFVTTPLPAHAGPARPDEGSGRGNGNNLVSIPLSTIGVSLVYNSASRHVWRLSHFRWFRRNDANSGVVLRGDGSATSFRRPAGTTGPLVATDSRTSRSRVTFEAAADEYVEQMPGGTKLYYARIKTVASGGQSLYGNLTFEEVLFLRYNEPWKRAMDTALAYTGAQNAYRLARAVDRIGNTTTFAANGDVIDAYGRAILTITPSDSVANWSSPASTTMTLTGRGGETYTVHWGTSPFLYTWSPTGYNLTSTRNVTKVTLPNGKVWNVKYLLGAVAYLAEVTDPDGRTTGYKYKAEMPLLQTDVPPAYEANPIPLASIIDHLGYETTVAYEPNTVRTADPFDDFTETFSQGYLVRTDFNGKVTEYERDFAMGGRVTKILRPSGKAVYYKYHAHPTDPYLLAAESDYDIRTSAAVPSSATVTRYEYFLDRKLLKSVSVTRGGKTTTTAFTYDALDLATSKTVDGKRTDYDRDAEGNLVRVVANAGAANAKVVYSATYNGRGQVLTETDRSGLTRTYTYDNATGYLVTSIDGLGRTTGYFDRNALGLPRVIDVPGPRIKALDYDGIGAIVRDATFGETAGAANVESTTSSQTHSITISGSIYKLPTHTTQTSQTKINNQVVQRTVATRKPNGNPLTTDVTGATGASLRTYNVQVGNFPIDPTQPVPAVVQPTAPVSVARDLVGLYSSSSGHFYLRKSRFPGQPTIPGVVDPAFSYGDVNAADWVPLAGDWDGDGISTVGLYKKSTSSFYLRDAHASGLDDHAFQFGPANSGWEPLVGDWDGDGVDTVGFYAPASGWFYLKNSHAGGAADVTFPFGPVGGRKPVVGDWDGNGTTTVGIYQPATGAFFLRNVHAGGAADVTFYFGPANSTWLPIAGDWNKNGEATVGLYNPTTSTFYLRNVHAAGVADVMFAYDPAGGTAASKRPLVGHW